MQLPTLKLIFKFALGGWYLQRGLANRLSYHKSFTKEFMMGIALGVMPVSGWTFHLRHILLSGLGTLTLKAFFAALP